MLLPWIGGKFSMGSFWWDGSLRYRIKQNECKITIVAVWLSNSPIFCKICKQCCYVFNRLKASHRVIVSFICQNWIIKRFSYTTSVDENSWCTLIKFVSNSNFWLISIWITWINSIIHRRELCPVLSKCGRDEVHSSLHSMLNQAKSYEWIWDFICQNWSVILEICTMRNRFVFLCEPHGA